LLLIVLPYGARVETAPAFVPPAEAAVALQLPRATETGSQPFVAAQEAHAAPAPSLPTRLLVPAIDLDSPIVALGVDSKGNMDVPSGTTNNVGWYRGGTVPGSDGAAVLDAHVFAAFKNLHRLHVGSDLYVISDHGTKLHFRVQSMETYKLAEIPLTTLFRVGGEPGLNLITCAGTFLPSAGTYSHRLVVYATLVN
jgi:LPXTG-site transpeptidase (sortase) family protein